MSRVITLLRVTLSLPAPWAVGGVPMRKDELDLPILVDPRGATPVPYLPATSLAGSLRAHVDRRDNDLARNWFGDEIGQYEESRGTVERTPSKLWALGTRIGGTASVNGRSRTALHRDRRAALGGSLRTEQAVIATRNRPTTVVWHLQHEGPRNDDLRELIRSWQPYVGRGRSIGQGEASVVSLERWELDLSRVTDLSWWLAGRHAWLGGDAAASPPTTAHDTAKGQGRVQAQRITRRWRLSHPLHIGAAEAIRDEPGTDPLASGRSTQVQRMYRPAGQLAIPGTTWKGVFRHRVEHVLQVVGHPEPSTVITALFGEAGHARNDIGGRRGVLRFHASPLQAGPNGGTPKLVTQTHVGIDRVTGGARDGLLFSVEAVDAGAETTLVISSDSPLPTALSNLLDHAVWDLHDGLIGLGGMTSRGYGWLELADPSVVAPGPVDSAAVTGAANALLGRTSNG